MTDYPASSHPSRWMALLVAGLVAAVALGLGGFVLLASVIGPSTPDADELPDVPEGYSLEAPGSGCGSGGCYLVSTVRGPAGLDAPEIADALDDSVSGCRAHRWFDRRQLCTGVQVIGDGDEVQVSVMLHDLGK